MEIFDRQLRYFLSIAELRSLSKAADVLDQTQSGLSKQLATLEATLGQALFIRTGRGLELTESGVKLYEATRPAYRDIDAAVESVRRQGVTHGTVRLATVHTLSYYFTSDVIASFVSTHPHVNLSLMGRSSPEVVALVESGKADLGFVYDSAVDSGALTSRSLIECEMALIVRCDSAIVGAQDLTKLEMRLVGFPPQYALRRMIHSAGLQPMFVAEVETIDVMLRLVSSGIGDCILPSRIPEKLLEEHGLRKVPVARPMLRRRVVLITRADRTPSALTADLIQCATHVAAGMGGGGQE
ncbi:LysR family transcriptional regulator [Polaromonas jejuensis]|uniref:LysR family transcriptional regulator n=1 Tax=Polaromonas jejuensis TaxID=457502 RepID=A0ABW0QBZ5_9BURK|nr:LysR family transcriptional regulator [Polaromonas jejuensis]